MTKAMKCSFSDQRFEELVEGLNGYLHAPQIGMMLVRDKKTGEEFLTHLVNAGSGIKIILAALSNNEKDDFASGKVDFWHVASESKHILIADVDDDYVIHDYSPTTLPQIKKYKKGLKYRENYKETHSMSQKISRALEHIERKKSE